MNMFLDRLAEILAAKRTPKEEREAKRTLKRLMEEKAAKDEMRKQRLEKKKPDQETEQKDPEQELEQKKEEVPKTLKQDKQENQETKIKTSVAKLQAMKKPSLFLINSNVTTTSDDPKEGRIQYQAFLSGKDRDEDEANAPEILKFCVNLSNKGGIHSWICDAKYLQDLKESTHSYDLEHFPDEGNQVTTLDLTQDEPFNMKFAFKEGIDVNPSELRKILNTEWSPIAKALAESGGIDKPEEETPETTPEETPETPEEVPEPTTEQEGEEETDTTKDEKEDATEDDDIHVEDVRIKVGAFRSLKDPYIFILDPRKKTAEYSDFLGPDKEGETKKASEVLPKALKLVVSRKLKSTPEGYPVIVYFMSRARAAELLNELKQRESRPFVIGPAPVSKDIFEKEEPFTKLKAGDVTIDENLVTEMNKAWMDATSEGSGNPVPAIQASDYVPMDFFRFLDKKQRQIQLYLGDRPEGAGFEGNIYVLASEQEATNFIRIIRKFKMPSLFYERMSANSDIDAGFKTTDPEEVTPANVLVLIGDGPFNPKELVAITEDNSDLVPTTNIKEQIIKLKQQVHNAQTKLKLKKDEKEKEKELENIKAMEKNIVDLEAKLKITQLNLLHLFAKERLGNKTKNVGTFIRGKYTIGTHVAQFNADMTICFLWGSHTQHVKIDPKETLKQLPFVKEVITKYL